MDRHRRHFTFRPYQACQIGTFCHKFSLHIALTPEILSAQFGHSLSRSLSWNLVFIAILADKLPPKQRDKARLIGLSLALIMRLGLLSVISWMVTLTKPLFTVMDYAFSGRDLIMLLGGIFLLFKATTELHERLENREHDTGQTKGCSRWMP